MVELSDKEKIAILDEYLAEIRRAEYRESYLISALHKAQELFGYLSRENIERIAYALAIPTAKIWGVATFYHYFNLKPVGKNILSVCLGTACYVKGACQILERLKEDLNIAVGDTTQDKLFTLQEARCLGACGQAPVVMINNRIYGKLTADEMSKIVKELRLKG